MDTQKISRMRSVLASARIGKFVVVAMAVTGVGLTTLSGCAAYVNYPPIGDDLAVNNPNIAPSPTIMTAALRHAVRTAPIQGGYVINLPEGMKRETADRILIELSDFGANLVTPETTDLPTYHITRIWVRGSKATVDVLRPVEDVLTPDGQPALQRVSVRLTHGFMQGWRVSGTRPGTIGAIAPPRLNGWEPDSTLTSAETAAASE